jgi:hypothetical protein
MEKNNEVPPAKSGTQSKIVETLAEDMAKVLEDDKSGIIKKIINEESKHEEVKMNSSPNSKKNRIFIFISFLFFLAGLAVLFYSLSLKKVDTVPIKGQFTPIIFIDQNTFLEIKDLKKDEIAQTVLNESNATKVKNGGVEGIYLSYNKKVIGLRQFIQYIKANFTPNNNTLFVSDNFLMGVVNDETKDFFILLKMRSITDIFDAMRAWEKKMFFDLHGFFGIDISSETKDFLTTDFEDGIVENKNARILYDKNGHIVMMYIYADDNSIIITNTEKAAREVMLRLTTSQVKK